MAAGILPLRQKTLLERNCPFESITNQGEVMINAKKKYAVSNTSLRLIFSLRIRSAYSFCVLTGAEKSLRKFMEIPPKKTVIGEYLTMRKMIPSN